MTREPISHTVEAPGCTLTYDVRGDLDDGTPLFMLASPMDAAGFTTLATYFEDRPVVTYDARGSGRSPRTDGALSTRVDEHAADIRRVIAALGVEQVDVFASSGGAVNGLAATAQHAPEIRTVVAHEPPAASALPDREPALALARRIRAVYDDQGFGAAMALFIWSSTVSGPLPDDCAEQPLPDPATFGLPSEDDGTRTDPLVGLNMPACLEYDHDLEALLSAPTRVVLAHGAESATGLPGRCAVALAGKMGIESIEFPSHHAGFAATDDPMMAGQPEAFATALRHVLDTTPPQEQP